MEKISFKEKLGFSAGEYAGSIVWQALMFFLPIFYTDTADYSEWKSGRRATGLVYSAATFSQKMGFPLAAPYPC